MSILIKGIDMPKEKDEALLLLILGDGTVAEKIGSDRYEEMTDTKAIQIPTPHGRLIDIDKVKDKLRDQIPCCGLDMTYSNSNAFDSMDNAPTILEAED